MNGIIKQLHPGDHVALFYRTRAEQFSVIIPYILEGLRKNERCLYIITENTIKSVLDALEAEGVDVASSQARNALRIASPAETYLRYGVFEPQKMIQGLIQELETTLALGFSAFRATGELSWATSLPSALARLHEYEAALDTEFPNRFLALCQYNENAFSPGILSQMLRVHPKVIARGELFENPFYTNRAECPTTELPIVNIEGLLDAVSA